MPTGLARLLAPFDIFPTTVRIRDRTAKRYRLGDLETPLSAICPVAEPHSSAKSMAQAIAGSARHSRSPAFSCERKF
jgi:hypothetical protein